MTKDCFSWLCSETAVWKWWPFLKRAVVRFLVFCATGFLSLESLCGFIFFLALDSVEVMDTSSATSIYLSFIGRGKVNISFTVLHEILSELFILVLVGVALKHLCKCIDTVLNLTWSNGTVNLNFTWGQLWEMTYALVLYVFDLHWRKMMVLQEESIWKGKNSSVIWF